MFSLDNIVVAQLVVKTCYQINSLAAVLPPQTPSVSVTWPPLLLVVAFYLPWSDRWEKALAVVWYLPVGAHHMLRLKRSTIRCWLVTSHGNHSGIPLSSQFHNHLRHGTNKTSSILSAFYLSSGITGGSSLVRRRKASPNHSLSSQRPPGPNNGRQECDDRTL